MKGKSCFAALIAVGFSAAISMAIATDANAAIVSVAGSGTEIAAPLNTDDNTSTSPTNQFGFNELQGVSASIAYTSGANIDTGFNIPMGATNLDSHMILFDIGDPGICCSVAIAEWTFDNPIVGIFSDQGGIFEMGSNGDFTTIPTTAPFTDRGLEFNDVLALLMPNVLQVTMNVGSPGDWIRVVTAPSAIPLPGAVWLFVSAIIGLVSFSRIKRGAVPA